MSPPVAELVKQLYRLGLVHRQLARHASQELGSQGFTALATIALEGPVRPSVVAQRLQVDLSVASRQVASLVASQYVERTADPDDGRAHLLRITPDGDTVLHASHARMVDAFTHALEAWDEDDVTALSTGLERLRAAFTPRSSAPEGSTA